MTIASAHSTPAAVTGTHSVLPGRLDLAFRGPTASSGRPVVLLHGLSASSNSWSPVIERFGSDWRIWALDFRGHGHSQHAAGEYGLDRYLDDAARLLRSIGEPAVLVGHSLGSVVAASLAQDGHPLVAAAFLEDPPLFVVEPDVFVGSPFATAFRQLADAVARLQAAGAPVEVYRDGFGATPHPAGDTQADHMFADALWARAESLAQMDVDAIEAVLDGRTFAGYQPDRPIQRPARVLRADPACGGWFLPEHENRLRQWSPHVDVVPVPAAAHNIRGDVDGRSTYLDALDEFLGSLT